jgi:hypothetical protein
VQPSLQYSDATFSWASEVRRNTVFITRDPGLPCAIEVESPFTVRYPAAMLNKRRFCNTPTGLHITCRSPWRAGVGADGDQAPQRHGVAGSWGRGPHDLRRRLGQRHPTNGMFSAVPSAMLLKGVLYCPAAAFGKILSIPPCFVQARTALRCESAVGPWTFCALVLGLLNLQAASLVDEGGEMVMPAFVRHGRAAELTCRYLPGVCTAGTARGLGDCKRPTRVPHPRHGRVR